MAVTFIGDVHGWSDRLERLLPQATGRLVFLGDLIDRGPDAPAVLDRVHDLCAAGRADCLLGNHEWMLVRTLGRDGADPDQDGFAAWVESWGGDAVLRSYGVGDARALKRCLQPHLDWLAGLPWLLEGTIDGRAWIAVHAGLDPVQPTGPQLAELRRGWAAADATRRPAALFRKREVAALPTDFPLDTVLVSGHTPQDRALVTPRRILCDTSGGLPRRPLTGVIWPELRVIAAE